MRTTPILIDGSKGEGGGQILRTALALSMVTGRPFRVERIRAGRQKPGLLRQHLTAVNAAAAICSATVDGATISSPTLTFTPGRVTSGEYKFAIGSAGSTTLVFQTVLPALMLADAPSLVTFEGGTHNPFAPPLDFIERAFLPIVRQMGPRVDVDFERAGFYPAGGGRWSARITPTARERLVPFVIESRGQTIARLATAVVAGLSGDIAKRELAKVREQLDWADADLQIRQWPGEWGPGNVVILDVRSERATDVFTSFGTRGLSAEVVGDEAAQQVRTYLASDVPIGPYLADQLMLPLALAGGGSFVTSAPTLHATTNAEIIMRFVDRQLAFEKLDGDRHRIRCD